MAESLLCYIWSVVGIAIFLKCSAPMLKVLFSYTNSYIVKIPKELYKTHVKKATFFSVIKK
jgi:hypothetical protein